MLQLHKTVNVEFTVVECLHANLIALELCYYLSFSLHTTGF